MSPVQTAFNPLDFFRNPTFEGNLFVSTLLGSSRTSCKLRILRSVLPATSSPKASFERSLLPEWLTQLYPFQNDPVANYCQLHSGLRLHFVDEGKGHPVIMLHGNPTWSFLYRNLIADLKNNYRTLALDHLGCGLSDKPQAYPYRLADHIQNAVEWFESLRLDRFSLILHDWGGPIGLALADRFFNQLDKLVLLNTAGFLIKRIPLRIGLLKIPKLGEYGIRQWNSDALCNWRSRRSCSFIAWDGNNHDMNGDILCRHWLRIIP